ncbi:hypothetical protein V6N12_015688 [Hibiscus sabdariffa]|uniref:Uncharacterized protein n=1 Tax=Hibiscus sabdariffa TaxID=183260 RepID=A0ABR2DNV9_9ROSI
MNELELVKDLPLRSIEFGMKCSTLMFYIPLLMFWFFSTNNSYTVLFLPIQVAAGCLFPVEEEGVLFVDIRIN